MDEKHGLLRQNSVTNPRSGYPSPSVTSGPRASHSRLLRSNRQMDRLSPGNDISNQSLTAFYIASISLCSWDSSALGTPRVNIVVDRKQRIKAPIIEPVNILFNVLHEEKSERVATITWMTTTTSSTAHRRLSIPQWIRRHA